MGKEDEGTYGINVVVTAALDSDVKIEPDDFSEKCIELDDFMTMLMLDIEMTDPGDDVEFPVFETIGLKNVSDNGMGNEDEGEYGINGIELAALDSDAKMEPDDFNEKCIELNDFVTMEMFDIEMTDLGDDVELPVFEAIGLKDVSDNCMGNEDEGEYAINGVETAVLDSDVKNEPDDCREKYIELDVFLTIEMYDIEMTVLGDPDELPVFGKIGPEDVADNCMGNEDERAYGINGVEAAALDSDAKMEPNDFNEKYIELNDFVTMEMFNIEMTDLGDDVELPVFETIGLKDVRDNCMGNEDEGAYGINGVEGVALDSDVKIEPDDFNEKCIKLDDLGTMLMLDIEKTDLGDADELSVFGKIAVEDVGNNCMGNEDEAVYGINSVDTAVLDSDVKNEPDDCNEKYIELDVFVTIEMYDIEMTVLGDADELPVFEKIGPEDVADNCMGNDDERAYGINGVELAALDSDAKIKPDDFNEKCIELKDLVTMEMFNIEMTDLGDDVELPVFETIGLKDVSGNCMGNEDEGAYGINGVEEVALDSDVKMEPDDFNEKCIELDGFATMVMLDIEVTDLGDADELPVFGKIAVEDVGNNCMGNEDERAYGINGVEAAALDSGAKMEPDDFIGKHIELDVFLTVEMFDIEMTDPGDDVELPVFETTGLKDVSDNCMGNEDEGGYGINGIEAAALDSDAKMEPDDFNMDWKMLLTDLLKMKMRNHMALSLLK